MFRKVVYIFAISIFFSSCFFGTDIEGVYREDSTNIGIIIERMERGDGYIVNRVFLNSSGSIRQRFEWQTAFIEADPLQNIMFYWKTGRVEETMPDSNKLIVYNLLINNDNLVGSYYFPEEPRTPSAEVNFIKVKEE